MFFVFQYLYFQIYFFICTDSSVIILRNEIANVTLPKELSETNIEDPGIGLMKEKGEPESVLLKFWLTPTCLNFCQNYNNPFFSNDFFLPSSLSSE